MKCFNPLNRSKSSSWLISFVDNDLESKNVEFYAKDTSIPSVSAGIIPKDAKAYMIPFAGGELTYGTLPISVLSDEGFEVYSLLYDKIRLGFDPNSWMLLEPNKFFITFVYILDNKGNPIYRVKFHHCRVKDLSDYGLDGNDTNKTFNFNIAYSYYLIEKIND